MLLRTPRPKSFESLFGYILRVSECNGYDTPRHILQLAGYNKCCNWHPGFIPDKLAAILNSDESALQAMRYRADDNSEQLKLHHHVLGAPNPHKHLRISHPCICPECIERDGHIDAFWDLSAAIACPIHGKTVLSNCPSCKTKLSWFRHGLNRCKCGYHFKRTDTVEAPEEVINLMRFLHSKCHNKNYSESMCIGQLPLEHLNGLSLRSTLELCSGLGKFDIKTNRASTNHKDRSASVSSAARILSNWPQNYHEFLKTLGEVGSTNGSSVRQRYFSFYISMFTHRKSSADFQFLKKEMLKFVSNDGNVGYVDSRMLSEIDDLSRFISSKTAASRLGVDQRTLMDWAKKGKISVTEFKAGNSKRLIVDTNGLTPPLSGPGQCLQLRSAGATIGLPTSVLKYLKGSGHTASQYRLRHKVGFHEADIKLLRTALLAKSPLIVSSDEHNYFHLDYVMQEKRLWSAIGKGELIAAYLDGKLVSPGRLNDEIASILFRRSDIEEFVRNSRAIASDNSVPFTNSATLLGCPLHAIPSLIREGHLISKKLSNGSTRICQKSLHEFAKQFAALNGICKEHRTSVRRLYRLCLARNIPILRLSYDSGRECIFIAQKEKAQLIAGLDGIRPKARIASDQALQKYFDNLTESGMRLPRRAGQPLLTEIAKACKFDRSVFYKNPTLAKLLSDFDKREIQKNPELCHMAPLESLQKYLTEIEKTGKPLPFFGKKPNIKAIANACGFKRDLFYEIDSLKSELGEYMKRHPIPSLH